MSTLNLKQISFPTEQNVEFVKTLRTRVNDYFNEKNITKYANANMIFKTIVMIAIYFIPYFLLISGLIQNQYILASLWALMGVGMAGIGMSVMHDANHGSYSKNKLVNKILGRFLDVVGGNADTWKIQHNNLHHSYTNVSGIDEDINPGKVMRFSPHAEYRKVYKYQHLYAWFLYGLMTVMWITTKDYRQIISYNKRNLLSKKQSFVKILAEISLVKVMYYAYALVIPLIFAPMAWWLILILFFVMHFIAGFILGIVFQPAHVMPTTEFPLPSENGSMTENWFVHQMHTTTDFSHKNNLFSWYIGGLNYQIEHHLFPSICHIHYAKLAEIVKKTAAEFKIPYHMQSSFIQALKTHGKMLKQLGKPTLAV